MALAETDSSPSLGSKSSERTARPRGRSTIQGNRQVLFWQCLSVCLALTAAATVLVPTLSGDSQTPHPVATAPIPSSDIARHRPAFDVANHAVLSPHGGGPVVILGLDEAGRGASVQIVGLQRLDTGSYQLWHFSNGKPTRWLGELAAGEHLDIETPVQIGDGFVVTIEKAGTSDHSVPDGPIVLTGTLRSE